ncbi:hypothetical protein QLY75_21190 [Cronobacter sakazakii]|nr:hypothetical protein [Cronobacter sakazakii]
MKRVILATLAIGLAGCAPTQPKDQKYIGSTVDIYSTSSVAIAQDRADKLCGSHAYFVSNDNDLKEVLGKYASPDPKIRFNCDLEMAAYLGSKEAYEIKMKRTEQAYKEMYKAQYRLKEARRRNADPKKLESYKERDPDGTIRSYSFLMANLVKPSPIPMELAKPPAIKVSGQPVWVAPVSNSRSAKRFCETRCFLATQRHGFVIKSSLRASDALC